MRHLLIVGASLHALHLFEEAFTRMHEDPIIVAAYAPLAPLGARHAAYLVFQLAFASGLIATLLAASGPRPRLVLAFAFALILIGEAHHLLRALSTHHYLSGLLTSLPLPFLGVLLAGHVLIKRNAA